MFEILFKITAYILCSTIILGCIVLWFYVLTHWYEIFHRHGEKHGEKDVENKDWYYRDEYEDDEMPPL